MCCVDPYNIKSVGYKNSLVVDGFISSDLKQHIVLLSRASTIDASTFIAETGASVVIEDSDGTSINLTETSAGTYLTPTLAGAVGHYYTLKIKTNDGKQFISDAVLLADNPGIKNIYATFSPDLAIGEGLGGVQVFLNTQDSSGNANYYRWEYEYTYEIKMPYPSTYKWIGGNNIVYRDVAVDHCWGSNSSKSIIIKSTVGLSEDKVIDQLIQTIPGYSSNLRIRYSILIKQYVLSQAAYKYWHNIQVVNQTQGTLYDTQPGTVAGNIHSTNTSETALGYFDAGVIKEKRAFFIPSDFTPSGYKVQKFLAYCDFYQPVDVRLNVLGDYLNAHLADSLVVSEVEGLGNVLVHLRPKICCDCTSLGTNSKPSFWPN
jgi:hypothetical protein